MRRRTASSASRLRRARRSRASAVRRRTTKLAGNGRARASRSRSRRAGRRVTHAPARCGRDRGGGPVRGAQLPSERARRRRSPRASTTIGEHDRSRVRSSTGRYTFMCDPHPARMAGRSTSGRVAPPATTPPPPTPTPAALGEGRRAARADRRPVSDDLAQDARREEGDAAAARRLHLVVRDRSNAHNARLRGAGVSRATGVGFVGTRTWRVMLRKGTLVVQCDPHSATMRRPSRSREPDVGLESLAADVPDGALRADVVGVREHPEHRDAPSIPSPSSRSKQRRAIAGETP